MSTDKPRYTITLDEEMLKKIDDFRFENRFPNRTQATLELIRLGLETLEKELKNTSVVDSVDKVVDKSLETTSAMPIDKKSYDELSKEEKAKLFYEELDLEEKAKEKSEVSQKNVLKSS